MVESAEHKNVAPDLTAGQIRQKRILSEIGMLKHLNPDHYAIEQSNDDITGFSIYVSQRRFSSQSSTALLKISHSLSRSQSKKLQFNPS